MNDSEFFYRGRWAISAALTNLGLEKGDNILFQAYTCIAVPKGIVGAGMNPIVLDVNRRSLFVDPEALEKVILKYRIKCFILQHTFGFFCPKSIVSVCERHNVKIIEDCAHLFQGYNQGRDLYKTDAKIFSLEWGKPIPAGIGGILEMKNAPNANGKLKRNLLGWIKIELQYIAFRALYRPTLFFTVKRVFDLLKGSSLVEDNGMDVDDFESGKEELMLRISPMVKKRYQRLLRAHKSNESHYGERINSLVKQFLEYKHIDKLNLDFDFAVPLRIPVMVENKAEVLREAARLNIPLGDWYGSPIDPLSENAIEELVQHSSNLTASSELSSSVVTIPLDRLQSSKLMARTLQFLEQRIRYED